MMVLEAGSGIFQSLEVPACISLRPKKLPTHIVVNADDTGTLPVEVLHGLGANQAAAACYKRSNHVREIEKQSP